MLWHEREEISCHREGLSGCLLVLMVGTLLVFCGIDHALDFSYNKLHELTYTYDTTQQLSSWTRSGVPTSYAYDARGNLTSMTGPSGTTSFTVDPATNRLLTMTVPGQYTDTWTYDAAGNPLTRTRSQKGTTQVTTYAYDIAGVSRESTTSSAPITYQHNGAGELVSLTWNGQTYYYHFNAHGDTIALSDSTGTLMAQYAYDPWGTVTTNTNPAIPNPYLYCGAWGVRWDADLSLSLMGARWYNPATGRFLTKDSYPPDLLAPLTQNPYQYCANNPIGYVDSTGELAFPGQIHNLVVNHIYVKYQPDMYKEQTIYYKFGWGRADLINIDGKIWDVKRDKPRQIASGVAQVLKYKQNTWGNFPEKDLFVGGYLPPDSFVATIGIDTYYISYHYVEGGIIAYDYYTVTDWQKVGEIATGVVMIAGAAFLIYVTGGAAAPVLIPLLAP